MPEEDPFTTLHNRYARGEITTEQYNETLKNLKNSQQTQQIQQGSEGVTALLKSGHSHLQNFEFNEALSAFDQVISIDPFSDDAWNSNGVVLANLKKYQEAYDAFNQAVVINPSNSTAIKNRNNAQKFITIVPAQNVSIESLKINERNTGSTVSNKDSVSLSNMIQEPFESQNIEKSEDSLYHAGAWDRWFAYVLDSLLIFGIFIGIYLLFFILSGNSSEIVIFLIPVLFIVYWLYFALSEYSQKQATLGKRALKLFVTDDEGNKLTLGRSLVRSFLKIILTITPIGLLSMINGLSIYASKRGKGLHDYLAGTLVLTEKITQKKAFSGEDQENKINWVVIILVVFIIIIVLILFSAIIAAFVFGLAGTQTS